jgi:hypothetical protein
MCFWLVMEECVRRGAVSLDMSWGTDWYKQRLGAHADDLWTATLYRSRWAQVRHWPETAAVGNAKVRRLVTQARSVARVHARHLAKRGLVALGWRQSAARSGAEGASAATVSMPGQSTQVPEVPADAVAQSGDGEDSSRSGAVD